MPGQEIDIIKITEGEIELLRKISVLTFTETFSDQNSDADMQKYIQENLSVQKLLTELHTIGSEFYFLRATDNVIGYLKLNRGLAQTEKQSHDSLEIERIYVCREFHGKGFGNLLLKQAINSAEDQQLKYIWLGVWEQNHKAISFYKKNGFIQFDTHVFKLGEDEQTDILMKLELN
ncbi:MAG: GNAT family N-acetyltransferase [Bacteroidota bacterium]